MEIRLLFQKSNDADEVCLVYYEWGVIHNDAIK